MGHRSHMRHAWRALWRRHGQAIGLCLIVATAMAVVGLLIWFMSDIRFRPR